jgi:hypothetical protein
MAFRVRIDPVALHEMEVFAAYLGDYSEDLAIEQFERLDRILSTTLRESPLTWDTSRSRERLIVPIYFGSGAEPNTGSR